MADLSSDTHADITTVTTSTRQRLTPHGLAALFAILATVAGIAFVINVTALPRHTDAYFLAKIPATLRSDSEITAYLVQRMRQIEHVAGGPMRNWVTSVAPIRHMTSPTPAIDPGLIFARLRISSRECGIFPALKRVPGVGKLVPRGNASRGNNYYLTVIFDKKSDIPSEILAHDRGLEQFLRDKKVSLKTAEDEEKLWNYFTALNLCRGVAKTATWLTPGRCEMVLTSSPTFETFVTVDVDKTGVIRHCRLDSR